MALLSLIMRFESNFPNNPWCWRLGAQVGTVKLFFLMLLGLQYEGLFWELLLNCCKKFRFPFTPNVAYHHHHCTPPKLNAFATFRTQKIKAQRASDASKRHPTNACQNQKGNSIFVMQSPIQGNSQDLLLFILMMQTWGDGTLDFFLFWSTVKYYHLFRLSLWLKGYWPIRIFVSISFAMTVICDYWCWCSACCSTSQL